MSREYLADILTTENAAEKAVLIVQYEELQQHVFFFQTKLAKLKEESFRLMSAQPTITSEAMRTTVSDIETLTKLIDTLNSYLEVIKFGSILGDKINKKMSENDIGVLKSQVAVMKKMRTIISAEETLPVARRASIQSSDKLSQLIADAGLQEYNVTRTQVWARRGITLLTGLVFAVAAVAAVAFLMTPAGHITAAAAGVVIALRAAAAFFGIGKAPIAQTHLSIGGYPVNIAATVPSTAGALLPAFFGAFLAKKLRFTSPVREEAARNMQAATINTLTNDLNKQIRLLPDGEVKTFLLKVVENADKMYNDGVNSWFHESQQSKMKKARLILAEVAKVVEGRVPATVQDILNLKINNSSYSFGQLLNAQRNVSFFSDRTSSIAENCGVKKAEHKAVDLSVFTALPVAA